MSDSITEVKYRVVKKMIGDVAMKIAEQRLVELAGDQELMLYRWPDGTWEIHCCNPSEHVMLGEVGGVYTAVGDTLQKTVDKLAALLAEDDAAVNDAEAE